MVDFNKLDKYIDYIERGEVPEIYTFNEFAVEFFNISKVVPLSKYLRSKNKTSKLPKIMNMKKAGEVLSETKKDSSEIRNFLRRKGYINIPDLNYTSIMLLRKVDLMENWKRILLYFGGGKTVLEINNTTRINLFPEEVKHLEDFLMENLKIDEEQLNWFLSLYDKASENKDILRAMRKLNKHTRG